jgi:hypothetical protein
MPFEPGKSKTGGRAKGVTNKKNQAIQELAQELNCNPAKILMLIAMGDNESLSTDEEIDLNKRKEAAKELMPYLYGKRKPVDSDGNDSTDIFSDILASINDRN